MARIRIITKARRQRRAVLDELLRQDRKYSDTMFQGVGGRYVTEADWYRAQGALEVLEAMQDFVLGLPS